MRRVVDRQQKARFDRADVIGNRQECYLTPGDFPRLAGACPGRTAPVQVDRSPTAEAGVSGGIAFDHDVPPGRVVHAVNETLREFTTARLRDGTLVSLRPLRDGETEPVLEVFEGLSPTSRYLRFLTPMPRLPSTMLRSLTRLDRWDRVAWGVRSDHHWVGLGQYVRLSEDPSTAELALSVVDTHHRRGLGRLLVETLAAVAAASGVRECGWLAHPENSKALALFRSLGADSALAGGVWEGRLSLPCSINTGVIDPAQIVRLAASAGADPVQAAA